MVCETKLHDLVLEVTDGGLEGSLLLIAVADPDNMIGVAKWSFENIFVLWSGAKAAPSSGSRYLLQTVQILYCARLGKSNKGENCLPNKGSSLIIDSELSSAEPGADGSNWSQSPGPGNSVLDQELMEMVAGLSLLV